MKGEQIAGNNNDEPGPRRRDYVVLQPVGLRELLEGLGWGDDDNWTEKLDAFPFEVLVKVHTVERTRNAEQALKKAGHDMLRSGDGRESVPAVAVPASQWSEELVHLTPRLDVEVG